MNKQEICRRACAKYAKRQGDSAQGTFRYLLNQSILAGFSEVEAEARALAFVREKHPGWLPIRAATQATHTASASLTR